MSRLKNQPRGRDHEAERKVTPTESPRAPIVALAAAALGASESEETELGSWHRQAASERAPVRDGVVRRNSFPAARSLTRSRVRLGATEGARAGRGGGVPLHVGCGAGVPATWLQREAQYKSLLRGTQEMSSGHC